MANKTVSLDVLQLEGLKVSPQASVPAFILLLLIYVFIMVSNIGLVVLILVERSLHEPMYLLFCNMSVNDVFGASSIIPRLLSDVLAPLSGRSIQYSHCAVQAFCAHFHAAASYYMLIIMAFDRYMAICNPLKYTTIMTSRMVVKLSAGAWTAALVFVTILLGLTFRLTRCRRIINNPFCDNPSLFKLSCQSLLINHIYGLFSVVVILGSSLTSIMLTYLRIAVVCLSSRNKTQISKALQTCATHLIVFFLLLLSGGIISILHRFPKLSDQRKLASILFHVVPPSLNAVIYGLQIRAVREKIRTIFNRKRLGK